MALPISWNDVVLPDGVVSFTYGKADVTAKAQGLWNNGTRKFACENSVWGDNWYGTFKSCQMTVSQGGKIKSFVGKEHGAFDLAPAVQCFSWNKQEWEGIPRSKNPLFTVCGLAKCTPCPKKPAPAPKPVAPVPTPATQCFTWNKQSWKGVPRSKNPLFTVCGLATCTPCSKK